MYDYVKILNHLSNNELSEVHRPGLPKLDFCLNLIVERKIKRAPLTLNRVNYAILHILNLLYKGN